MARTPLLLGMMAVLLAGTATGAQAEFLKFGNKKQEKVEAEPEAKADSAKEEPKQAAPAQPARSLYDRDYIGGIQTYVTKYEDTMIQIARNYNVGFVELRAANPYLDPWMPGANKKILIPSMHILPRAARDGVVINLAEMRMYTFLKAGETPKSFPLGIGREGLSTPIGTTTIVRKKDGPTWRPTARMRSEHPELPVAVPPGPDNPMGTHAIYLGWPEYAIHGTDKPYSIGRRASAGCLRMYPEDIVKAFGMLPVGTRVTVVNQPVKTGWVGDKLYLEAHPTTEQADKMEIDGGLPGYVFSEDEMGLILDSAGEYANALDWSLIRQVIRERRGYPVEILTRGAPDKKKSVEQTAVTPAAEAEKAPEKAPEKAAEKVADTEAPKDKPKSGPVTTPN